MGEDEKARLPDGRQFYSASSQIGSRDRSVAWYDKTFSGVPADARELLEKYSKIPSDEVEPHVLAMVSQERLQVWFARLETNRHDSGLEGQGMGHLSVPMHWTIQVPLPQALRAAIIRHRSQPRQARGQVSRHRLLSGPRHPQARHGWRAP